MFYVMLHIYDNYKIPNTPIYNEIPLIMELEAC